MSLSQDAYSSTTKTCVYRTAPYRNTGTKGGRRSKVRSEKMVVVVVLVVNQIDVRRGELKTADQRW